MNKVYIVVNFGFGTWTGEGSAYATPCASREKAIAEFERQKQEIIDHIKENFPQDEEFDFTYYPADGDRLPHFKIDNNDEVVELSIEVKDILE